MATEAQRLLALARKELGVTEFPPGSNWVKYNTAYYGREVSGEALNWCAVFVWWLFQQLGKPELYYGGGKTAYCPALLGYHARQAVKGEYQPGDVVFFNFSGGTNAQHVGVCESADADSITTIDGNTGTGCEANGGGVMRRRRHKRYIVGAYRPGYEEENEMTQEQFDAMLENWLERQSEMEPGQEWMREGVKRAVAAGISDGSRPMGLCTRAEAMMMAAAARQ